MIEINGAFGEGGGQILRSSLTLSALLMTPVHIQHIRTNRSKPGLRPQHLAAVNAIARLTEAEVSGAHLGSQAVTLRPVRLRSGRYRFDIPTAGALTLVMQTVFFPLSFAPGTSQLTLTGGTHVPWSPIYPYLQEHWLPVMAACGFRAETRLHSAGFYPAGGGQVSARIFPIREGHTVPLLVRGELTSIRGVSGVANLGDQIAKRQKHRALQRLYPVCQDTKIQTVQLPSPGKGTFILLNASFANSGRACFTALGAPGKPAEQVADEAVDDLLAFLETDGCVDPYLADQLILPLLTVNGDSAFSTSRITSHLLTQAHVIEQFLPGRITLDGRLDAPGVVQVHGGINPP